MYSEDDENYWHCVECGEKLYTGEEIVLNDKTFLCTVCVVNYKDKYEKELENDE